MTSTETADLVAATGFARTSLTCHRSGPAGQLEQRLQSLLEDTVQARSFERGVALHLDSRALGLAWNGTAGLADPSAGEPMTARHPVRIASNTKTYVAAAVLRLWEDRRLGLDDPVRRHLPAELADLLAAGGYRPDAITIRHLLTHTGGLDDHGTERYAERILATPAHRWSRAEQVGICVREGRKQGDPGEVFRYSDTGYVLLGEILERTTGKDLAGAVWELVDRQRAGLTATWFESLEAPPAGVPGRAHQFHGDVDVTEFDPSFDLWGGGGIVATVGDLARFTRALFTGRLVREPATLEEMLATFDGLRVADADTTHLPAGAYRKGVWVLAQSGLTLHRHTGFWGTSATWIPELDLVVTATVNQHEAGELRDALVEGAIALVGDEVHTDAG